jgi:hypothetical protein
MMTRFIEQIAYRLSEKNRQKKFDLFLNIVSPKENEAVLDVGVNDEEYSESDNYLEKHYPFPQNITAVSKQGLDHFKKRYPNIRAVVADGRALPFRENEFSISYSNAVIEHVGTREDQLNFLRELFRVSRKGFLTTPNRHFPIEVHTRVPLLHIVLTKSFFDIFLKKIGKTWATGNYMNLLSISDLRTLLDKARISQYQIIKNRLFGFTVTFTIIWNKEDSK